MNNNNLLGAGLALIAATVVFLSTITLFADLADSERAAKLILGELVDQQPPDATPEQISAYLASDDVTAVLFERAQPSALRAVGKVFSLWLLLLIFAGYLVTQLFATNPLIELVALMGTVFCVPFFVAVFAFQYYRLGVCDPTQALDCAYFSAVTMTTLGYGDISPTHREARLLATIEAFIGFVVVPVLVAQLVNFVKDYKDQPPDGSALRLEINALMSKLFKAPEPNNAIVGNPVSRESERPM